MKKLMPECIVACSWLMAIWVWGVAGDTGHKSLAAFAICFGIGISIVWALGRILWLLFKACPEDWRRPDRFILALATFLLASNALGQPLPFTLPPPATTTVRLGWNPVPGAAIYRVYWGGASRAYTNFADVAGTLTNAAVQVPRSFLNYFAVTTIDSMGTESLFSNEVINSPFTNVVLSVVIRTAPTPLGPWTDLATVFNVTNPPGPRFFNTVLLQRRQQ